MAYSYHIFYFPFKWKINGFENELFSKQVDLNHIDYTAYTAWERTPAISSDEAESLYNEKNYYYKFVHPILYDNPNDNSFDLIRHFERMEPKANEVYYWIKKKKGSQYKLVVESINLNLYATGVGLLSFYLRNEEESQNNPEDILMINQYGRRIFPPFFGDIKSRNEVAECISITGLHGEETRYKEDFNNYTVDSAWKPAAFIRNLITDLSTNISIEPVVDDRMFVATWYKNDDLATCFSKDNETLERFMQGECQCKDFWYRFVFVDGSDMTCQNDKMKKNLLEKHSYTRWQKYSSLYGISKYSLVLLAKSNVPPFILENFQSMYARMIELVLVQRASMLRFSEEVTMVSKLSNQDAGKISDRISSLYREYIRFINQVYFREVTAQDQGIEIYEMLQNSLKMDQYIKDLDGEIEELHQYVSLLADKEQNKKATFLNNIATIFLFVTGITGFWGMNKIDTLMSACSTEQCGLLSQYSLIIQLCMIVVGIICACLIIYNRRRRL